ncbi:MAG TPA: LiaF domain-containing protein [Gemmatimonadaceae bacterium]|nr:LiaF domain-containing protein [Gemmatimonadaceae bacterium]
MSLRAHCVGAASVFALSASGALAQTWRTVDASRQLRDTTAISVRLEYAAGTLELRPTTGGSLYQMNVRYDAERSEPISRYDASARSLTLGVRSHGLHLRSGSTQAGSMHAELSNKVPMDLSLELGAVEADIQLGGLRLTDLTVKTGAADVAVRFDQPNPDRLRSMTLEVGAASLKLVRAGNSGVERVNANVGVGALDLDLGGELTRDVDVLGSLAMGGFTLHVPREIGVSVDASTFLADFDKSGLVKRGDLWYTPGYEEARRHVRVRVKAFLGGFTVVRDSR